MIWLLVLLIVLAALAARSSPPTFVMSPLPTTPGIVPARIISPARNPAYDITRAVSLTRVVPPNYSFVLTNSEWNTFSNLVKEIEGTDFVRDWQKWTDVVNAATRDAGQAGYQNLNKPKYLFSQLARQTVTTALDPVAAQVEDAITQSLKDSYDASLFPSQVSESDRKVLYLQAIYA